MALAFYDGLLLSVNRNNGELAVIDRASNRVRATIDLGTDMHGSTSIAVDKDTAFIATGGAGIVTIDLKELKQLLGAEKAIAGAERWPGSDSTLDTLAPFTATVIAATAKGNAEIVSRHSSHMSTAMDTGDGELIRGGGYVTFAYCRQKFQTTEVLHGSAKTGDRVLEYGYVEKSDAFPGPRDEEAIPSNARTVLLLGKDGRIMKALPDTKENRTGVRRALSRYR
jgi:hypothetical protein